MEAAGGVVESQQPNEPSNDLPSDPPSDQPKDVPSGPPNDASSDAPTDGPSSGPPSDPHGQLIQWVDQADERLRVTGLLDGQFKTQVGQLNTFCAEILDFAHEYDYAPEYPYNGFRSFVKVVHRYFEKVTQLLQNNVGAAKLPLEMVQAYVDFLPLLLHQMEGVKLVRELKDIKPDETDASMQIELKIQSHQLKLQEKMLEPFYYAPVFGFWLPKSIPDFFLKGNSTIAFFLFPLTQSIPAMVNKRKMARLMADRSANGSINEVNKENKVRALTLSTKPPPNSAVVVHQLTNRQNVWLIDKQEKKVIQNEKVEELKNTKAVRLVIVKPRPERKNDQVIFHIHGGAWIMGKPEWCYASLIKNWINELGVTVVSIDYTLAPAEMYPVALQEITDAYIWLTDSIKKNEALEPLGFVPSDIVVTGESAGGNLTLSLAIVLAEIRKLSPDAVKMPKAFSPLYPCHSPANPLISASSVLLDVVLNCSLRLKCSSAYLANDIVDTKVSYLNGKNNPWFKDEEKVRDFYIRVNGDRKSDPILHVLTYDFESLKDIPLYVQAAEFDPLLDDSILISKLWKGKVVLDVLPDVVHGFNFFKDASPECKKADDLLLERMREALNC